MALNLPPAYTAQTKNECVNAVVDAIEAEISNARDAARSNSVINFLDDIQKGYYYAGFGAALSILSTSHLSSEVTDKLNQTMQRLIRAQYWIRAKCLNVSPANAEGDPTSQVRPPLLGKKVNSAQLAGWETNESRQILTLIMLNQILLDIGIAAGVSNPKNKIDKKDLADFVSTILNDNFLFGFFDGIKFARGDDEFARMEKKVRVQMSNGEYKEYSPLDCMAMAERNFKSLGLSSLVSNKINAKGTKAEPVESVKPPKTVTAVPPVAQGTTELSRYFRAALVG